MIFVFFFYEIIKFFPIHFGSLCSVITYDAACNLMIFGKSLLETISFQIILVTILLQVAGSRAVLVYEDAIRVRWI